MGKATADLPDPLTASEGPGNAGTDDLLAQLAGEEIDRLLAEAQVERPSDSSSEFPQPTTPAATPAARPISAPKEPASTSFSAWRTDDADMKAAESAESSILKGAPSVQSSSTLLTGTKPAEAAASSTPTPDPLAEEGGAAVASIQKTALLPEFDAPRAEREIAAVVGPLDDAALDPEIQE